MRSSSRTAAKNTVLAFIALIGIATLAGCGSKSSSPIAPSTTPDPDPAPVPATFTLSGRVLDGNADAPLAAARVEITRAETTTLASATDGDGRYQIGNLAPGTYTLRASADGFDPSSMSVEVASDKVIDVALVRAGEGPEPPVPPDERWTLSGKVSESSSGTPLPGATVEIVEGVSSNAGRTAVASADGTFSIADLEGGPLTLRASAEGFVKKSLSVTLTRDASVEVTLERAPPPGPAVAGTVTDVLTDRPLSGVTVRIDGGGEAVTDARGVFTVSGVASREFQPVVLTAPNVLERRTYVRTTDSAATITLVPREIDSRALDEMLRARGGLHRWTSPPRLVIERRSLVFTNTSDMVSKAGSQVMSEGEATDLAADLAWALAQLTGGAITSFSSVDVVLADEGAEVTLSRPGTILVARYEGLQTALSMLGYSRWAWNAAGEVQTGVLMLDSTFDQSGSGRRRALRAHELGHTLGYDHVTTRESVMHPAASMEPTPFDHAATKIAFHRPPLNVAPDIDPDPGLGKPASAHLTWAGAE
jgi:hypothetical protein